MTTPSDDRNGEHTDPNRDNDTDGINRPLISPRSPSYQRARDEHAHPSATPDPMLVAGLARLCEAEHDAAQMCSVAAELFEPATHFTLDEQLSAALPDDADNPYHLMQTLASAHERHRDALASLLRAIGAAPPDPGAHGRLLSRDPQDLRYGKTPPEIIALVSACQAELETYYQDWDAKRDQALQQTQPNLTAATHIAHLRETQHATLKRHQSLLAALALVKSKRL